MLGREVERHSFRKNRTRTVGLGLFEQRAILVTFFLLLLFVAAVSVHDAALVVLNAEAILEFEKNPIGSLLIQLGSGKVWMFVGVKLLGTSLVCAILASLYQQSRFLGIVIASPIACFQAMLIIYLYTN